MSDTTRRSDQQALHAGKTDWVALDALTDAEVEAAATADPDCPLPRPGQVSHRMARAKRMRFGSRLSQPAFAERYHIPLATLVAWERHEAEPDAVVTAFLDAITADPDAIAAALARSRQQPVTVE